MARDGAQTINDYRAAGLAAIRITCSKCSRRGRYSLERAEALWGYDARLTDIHDDLTKDCPRNLDVLNMHDRCGAFFEDRP